MSKLNRILDIHQNPINLLFISSYLPRKCGIATFAKDLTKAINDLNPQSNAQIVAVNNNEHYEYPPEVVYQINRDDLPNYEDAAKFINHTTADIICLQHEYGLYGGDNSEYIFKLIGRIRQPLIITLHTILKSPTDQQRDVLFRLAKLSQAVVAMTPDAKEQLEEIYGINPDQVVVIHHGVADRAKATKADKVKYGWENRHVLLMTGLLNPDKGLDYVIRALPAIKEQFPDILFVIAGQTHPEIIKNHGEVYRDGLKQLIDELGVHDNIQFIDRYLSLDELLSYYEACDIYLTPHLNSEQIASGTLAYALGMGKACVSTPFVYAREILANGTGVFIEYKDSISIEKAVLRILSDPSYQASLENKAYAIGRRMSWPLVAERYLLLFRIIQELNGLTPAIS